MFACDVVNNQAIKKLLLEHNTHDSSLACRSPDTKRTSQTSTSGLASSNLRATSSNTTQQFDVPIPLVCLSTVQGKEGKSSKAHKESDNENAVCRKLLCPIPQPTKHKGH